LRPLSLKWRHPRGKGAAGLGEGVRELAATRQAVAGRHVADVQVSEVRRSVDEAQLHRS